MKRLLTLILVLGLLVVSVSSYAAWDATAPANTSKPATEASKMRANWDAIADGSVPQQGTSYVDFDVDSDLANGPAATISKTGVVFEGTVADSYETTVSVTDPTGDRTVTIPDNTGTVLLDTDIANQVLSGASPIVLEGATANTFETTIAVTDPTADRTITLPNATTTMAGLGVAQTFTEDQIIGGTTPLLTVGDAGEEDAQINFDGNEQDWHVGLKDTTNTLNIGLGTTLGTTDHIVITSSGEVTKPLQPAFSVHPTSTQSDIANDTSVTVIFGTERFDTGGNFASNAFTAPVTGKYHLNLGITFAQVDTGASDYYATVTTSNKSYYHLFDPAVLAADTANWSIGFSVVADMDAADTASIVVYQTGGQTGQTDIATATYFTGALLN